MALQWMILTYVVVAEAALAFLLTIPVPKLLKQKRSKSQILMVTVILVQMLEGRGFFVPNFFDSVDDSQKMSAKERALTKEGRGKPKASKSVSRSHKADLQFSVGRIA
ncbi:hypothetical protein ACFX15_033247 [Malus domestica]